MQIDASFSRMWESAEEFEFSDPKEKADRCIYGQKFAEWVEDLYQDRLGEDVTVVEVNQAKVLLLDRFFEWRRAVPKYHRLRLGERGHTCIFQVFVEAYEKLKLIELSLVLPLLFRPPPPPAAPQIAGIFLGEGE